MRRSEDFADVVRSGARRGTQRVVVHLHGATGSEEDTPLVGVVVSKAIGNAVDRNLVNRRLRGLLSSRLADLEPGQRVVVRALPAARGAAGSDLAGARDAAVAGARRRIGAAR